MPKKPKIWTDEERALFREAYGRDPYEPKNEPKEVKPLTVPQRIDTSAQAIAEGRQVSSADSQLVKASGSKALNKIVFGEAPKTEAQQLDSVEKYWGARISVMKNQALSKIMEGKGTAADTTVAFPRKLSQPPQRQTKIQSINEGIKKLTDENLKINTDLKTIKDTMVLTDPKNKLIYDNKRKIAEQNYKKLNIYQNALKYPKLRDKSTQEIDDYITRTERILHGEMPLPSGTTMKELEDAINAITRTN